MNVADLTAEQLLEAAMAFPIEVREELGLKLLGFVDDDGPPNLHPDWQAELDRRSDELLSGKVEGIPAEEVMREIRETLNERRQVSSGGAAGVS
jgi:putative addiction module component (TIGR02574 family)